MSISEKTLEIAVTHEILSLADNFIGYPYLYGHRYGRHWAKKLPYVTGLSLDAEKKSGYDVKITLPRDFMSFGSPYIYFLQFKKGYHKDYSANSASIFYGSSSNKQKHILFGLNNNSSKDQHVKLRNLYNSNRTNNHVLVGYALPIISTTRMYKNCIGDLLVRTPIYEVIDIDNLASIGHVGKIEKDESHHIALSYDGSKKEIRSTPQEIEPKDISLDFFKEIFTVRLYKTIQYYRNIYSQNYRINVVHFFQTLVHLGFYLKVEPNIIEELLSNLMVNSDKESPDGNTDFIVDVIRREIQTYKRISIDLNSGDKKSEFLFMRRQEFYKKLINVSWVLYSELSSNEKLRPLEDIIKMEFLFPLETMDNEISLKFEDEEMKETNLSEIDYTII